MVSPPTCMISLTIWLPVWLCKPVGLSCIVPSCHGEELLPAAAVSVPRNVGRRAEGNSAVAGHGRSVAQTGSYQYWHIVRNHQQHGL